MSKDIRLTVASLLFVATFLAAFGGWADDPPTAGSEKKLNAGLSHTAQLLQLMDTDKNGKVSKEEFMRFMEAEFELADTDKSGELDPKELQRWLRRFSRPIRGGGPGR